MKEIYLVHVDGYIGTYLPSKCPVVSYVVQNKFIDFAKSLRESYPEYRLRCVINEGIEEHIRKKIIADKLLTNKMQNIR